MQIPLLLKLHYSDSWDFVQMLKKRNGPVVWSNRFSGGLNLVTSMVQIEEDDGDVIAPAFQPKRSLTSIRMEAVA